MITPLSDFEMQLVTDPNVMVAKNRIVQVVYNLFGELAEEYKMTLDPRWVEQNELANAKISRGENYRGLPYVIMDYPRQFGKTDVFAVRSFFWWGNFFSITLHLAGNYKQKYEGSLQDALSSHLYDGWYISSSADQWQHHFEPENYIPVEAGTTDLSGHSFIKLAKKIPLTEWEKTYPFFKENFKLIVKSLQI